MQRNGNLKNVGLNERLVSGVIGGGLILFGMVRRKISGLILGALGAGLLQRGVTGRCQVYGALNKNTAVPRRGILVSRSMTISRAPDELYRFWRDLENLPRFMQHLQTVKALSPTRSQWVTRGPAGSRVEWDAEIIDDVPNELIVWRSTEGADVENEGAVRFSLAPGGRGTEVRVTLRYNAPGGKLGSAVARLFGEDPEQQVADDLRHFKQMMETGEVPTTQGQSSGATSNKASALLH